MQDSAAKRLITFFSCSIACGRSNDLHSRLHIWRNIFLLSCHKLASVHDEIFHPRETFPLRALLKQDQSRLLAQNTAPCCGYCAVLFAGSLCVLRFGSGEGGKSNQRLRRGQTRLLEDFLYKRAAGFVHDVALLRMGNSSARMV